MSNANEINEQIKNTIEISDVIGSYIKIHKAGKDYRSVCPFHDDSDPSLSISNQKKIFKCFPCGAKGDAITFVMLFEKVSYPVAVQKLIEKFNLSISGFKVSEESNFSKEKKTLFKINKIAVDTYLVNLFSPEGEEAIKYLNSRGIEIDLINKFDIGFVSPKDDTLIENLRSQFSLEEIRESNLFIESGSKFIPFFKNRIIFPIKDFDGNVLGFSGRVFGKSEENEKHKYLNSKDNKIFKKSEITYNLDNAKGVIDRKDEAIVVEGYMDVIALEKIGINNSIAIMGVAFTKSHVQLISKYSKNITMMLDSDNAGTNAMLSVISDSEVNADNYAGVSLKFVYINDSKDPDDFVTKFGQQKTIELIESKQTSIMFTMSYYEKENDLKTPDGKVEFKNKMLFVVSKLKNITDRKLLLQEISSKISIDINILNEEFESKYKQSIPKPIKKVEYEPIEYGQSDHLFTPQFPDYEVEEIFRNPMDYMSKTSFAVQDLLKGLDWTVAYLKSQELLIAAMVRDPMVGYEKITKSVNLFFSTQHIDIIKTILKIYKEVKYDDDNLDLIIKKVKDYNKEYLIPIIEEIYSGIDIVFEKEKIIRKLKISTKVIEDSISTLELRRMNKDILTYQDLLIKSQTKQESNTLLDNVNLLIRKREKHIKKMKKAGV
ncbi:DNA primase [Spiroplasma endosymbiont of Othius punctulatus]|uniref:DNA primase n=1 Tax=Spiroplasma endosymbiont of Othius punctulatus TaxID=3066289 RepID=UPI0030D229F8